MLVTVMALALAGQSEAERYAIGRYAVRDARSRTVCTLRLRWNRERGGGGTGLVEVGAPCALPTLTTAYRWLATNDGYRIEDVRHRPLARLSDDDAGLFMEVRGTTYRLEPADQPPAPSLAVRAAGVWKAKDNDARILCRFELKRGGAIGPTTQCPATLKPFGGGHWVTTEETITLHAPTGRTKVLNWEDENSLNGDNNHLAVQR